MSFGQEKSITGEVITNDKNISYVFINEYGFYIWPIGYNGIFVNGICFNKTQDIIGLGVGVEFDIAAGFSVPIFANYRHCFSNNKNLEPLLNIAVGTRLLFSDTEKQCTAGLYCVVASGFRFRKFTFTTGLFAKSWGNNQYEGGIEIKFGYIIKK